MTSVAIVGSTGLVGSQILSTLVSLPSISVIHNVARRAKTTDTPPKLQSHLHPDNSTWSSTILGLSPSPNIFFSGLGTTRGVAGSLAEQRKIDYELNAALARAAKASGTKVYVLVSSSGASSSSFSGYMKMKGELEDTVREMGFERTVILRPGLIVGKREEKRMAEGVMQWTVGWLGTVTTKGKDVLAQDGVVIARAAVVAGMRALEGTDVPKVWELGSKDIVRLGRDEWSAWEAKEMGSS